MSFDTLAALIGKQVIVTSPASHGGVWGGNLIGLADHPTLILEQPDGTRLSLPQTFKVVEDQRPVARFRKKPVEVEARRFETNNEPGGSPHMDSLAAWIGEAGAHDGTSIFIETLEGKMRAEVGDWIVKGVQGEFYPIKPKIFEATYEAVPSMTQGTF